MRAAAEKIEVGLDTEVRLSLFDGDAHEPKFSTSITFDLVAGHGPAGDAAFEYA